jgi:hypothetical protein
MQIETEEKPGIGPEWSRLYHFVLSVSVQIALLQSYAI